MLTDLFQRPISCTPFTTCPCRTSGLPFVFASKCQLHIQQPLFAIFFRFTFHLHVWRRDSSLLLESCALVCFVSVCRLHQQSNDVQPPLVTSTSWGSVCRFPVFLLSLMYFCELLVQETATTQWNGGCFTGGLNKILRLHTVMEYLSMLGFSALVLIPIPCSTMVLFASVLCIMLSGSAVLNDRCGSLSKGSIGVLWGLQQRLFVINSKQIQIF